MTSLLVQHQIDELMIKLRNLNLLLKESIKYNYAEDILKIIAQITATTGELQRPRDLSE